MDEIIVTVPSLLASTFGGNKEIKVLAKNLRMLIDELAKKFGNNVKERFIDSEGKLRPVINIYVNGKNVRFSGELETDLNPNDKVTILPAVAGG